MNENKKKFRQGKRDFDSVKALAPEEVNTSDRFTFSYNPSAQPVREGNGRIKRLHIKEFIDSIRELFDRCKNCDIKCVWELSRKGRFHIHGSIKFINIMEFYVNDLQRLIFQGALEIDKINDPEVWEVYIYKQRTLMERYAEDHCFEYQYDSSKKVSNSYPSNDCILES